MEIMVGILILLFLLAIFGNICSSVKNDSCTYNENVNINKFKRTSFSVHNYYGGYDDIMDIKQAGIGYDEEGYFFLKFFTQEKHIPISDITEISTKTEQQLKEEVTLGRFLLVGALAFLWKKTKVENRKFVIISYLDKEDNKNRNIIIESKTAELLYKELNNVLKKYGYFQKTIETSLENAK